MRVFIANFGVGNWAWPECQSKSSIAVMDDVRVHKHWLSGDRNAYFEEARRSLRLSNGGVVTRSVASRWFNLNNILSSTADDLWIHREKEELWWTLSGSASPSFDIRPDPMPVHGSKDIYMYFKRCSGWSDRDKRGARLSWRGLHARAREFLFTEGTYRSLSPENALYALALIEGKDLSSWHDLSSWRGKADRAKRGAVTTADQLKRTAVRMTDTALSTMSQGGQVVVSQRKIKDMGFESKLHMETFVEGLLKDSMGICALTELSVLLDGDEGNREFLASLDRIDSSIGYVPDNLQIVCRFANRWKSASDNEQFLKLISHVKGAESDLQN